MRKADKKGPADKRGTHHPSRRNHQKAADMREAVRKAIESLLEKKRPENGPRRTCVLLGWLVGTAAFLANLQ